MLELNLPLVQMSFGVDTQFDLQLAQAVAVGQYNLIAENELAAVQLLIANYGPSLRESMD